MTRTPRNVDHDLAASKIAEEALPGWKAVKTTSAAASEELATDAYAADEPPPQVDAVMPSLDELKAKYVGARGAGPDAATPSPSSADAAAAAADTALVQMEAGPLKKTVAVSKSQKKVIWSQG
jgi:hypothetical protein